MATRILSKTTKRHSWLAALLVGGLFTAQPVAAQWVVQNSGLAASSGIQNISIVDANNVWAAGYDGSAGGGTAAYSAYTRTTNGGTTWTPGNIPSSAGVQIIGISAATATTAWACAVNSTLGGGFIYYTTTGGTTWTRQLTAGFPRNGGGFTNGVVALDANTAFAAGDPLSTTNAFEVYYTTDAGTTWTASTVPSRLTNEYGLAGTVITVPGTSITARSCWFGTDAGRVMRSTDSGKTWAAAATGLAKVSSLAFTSTLNGVAVNADDLSFIAATTDGGATWRAVTPTGPVYGSGLSNVPGRANAYVSTGAATGASGSSYTLNSGATWTAIDAGVQHTAVAFFNSATGWSGGFSTSTTVGGLFKGSLAIPTATTAANRADLSLSVFPNPASKAEALQVQATGLSATSAQVQLFDALGRAVWQGSLAGTAAERTLSVPVRGQAAGLYVLRLSTAEGIRTQRLVLQ